MKKDEKERLINALEKLNESIGQLPPTEVGGFLASSLVKKNY